MNRSGSSRNFVSETVVVETSRKHSSTVGAYRSTDVIRAQAKKSVIALKMAT